KRPPKSKHNAAAREEWTVRLSTKGRYAVMAMADLASREAKAGPVSLGEIAESQEISLSYLEQLFAKLRKGGLVVSVRGPGAAIVEKGVLGTARLRNTSEAREAA